MAPRRREDGVAPAARDDEAIRSRPRAQDPVGAAAGRQARLAAAARDGRVAAGTGRRSGPVRRCGPMPGPRTRCGPVPAGPDPGDPEPAASQCGRPEPGIPWERELSGYPGTSADGQGGWRRVPAPGRVRPAP